jgi:hypothetical protein
LSRCHLSIALLHNSSKLSWGVRLRLYSTRRSATPLSFSTLASNSLYGSSRGRGGTLLGVTGRDLSTGRGRTLVDLACRYTCLELGSSCDPNRKNVEMPTRIPITVKAVQSTAAHSLGMRKKDSTSNPTATSPNTRPTGSRSSPVSFLPARISATSQVFDPAPDRYRRKVHHGPHCESSQKYCWNDHGSLPPQ